MCLSHPEHGYYCTQAPLGRAGDFVTAPEVSQMFGELIGLWSAVVWSQLGAPERINLVELGPGRGTLMADALRALRGAPEMLAALHVHLVDISPVLKSAQADALKGIDRVAWHAHLADVPEGPLILIGNEYLDALPVRQVIRKDRGWCERVVDWKDQRFVFAAGAEVDPKTVPRPVRDAEVGEIYEWSPAVSDVVGDVADRVNRAHGAALFIDYGYARDGLGDTIQAVSGHAFADPMAKPGHCDLTAHVNFEEIASISKKAGARTWGPVSQSAFLERLGIGARTAALLTQATHAQATEIATARDRLTSPDAMGALFKAIAVTGGNVPCPPGFEAAD